MNEILISKIKNFENISLRKKILLALYQADRELSYDELVDVLAIKTRKRLTDATTVLRKNSMISQNLGVKITPLGYKTIESIIQKKSK